MKKNLIALAVAGALAAPVAMADSNVTVYGVANVSFDMTSTGNNTAGTPGFSGKKVSSNTSRLGFKGNEDLGDGLKAIWQVETLISIDGGSNGAAAAPSNGLATRNTFAGLSGGFGTVLLGRHDTPYKLSTRSYDLFGDTLADNRGVMGGGSNTVLAPSGAKAAALTSTGAGASFDGRQTDVVAYVSPKLGGFTGIVAYVAGAEGQTAVGQSKGAAWSLAAMYGEGPFSGSFAYEVHDVGTAPGTVGVAALPSMIKESAYKLGAGYKVDAFEVNAVYEKTKDNFGGVAALGTLGFAAGANVLGHNAYYFSGKYNLGANAVKLAYGKAGDNATVNTGASQVSLGLDHSLSKRTTLYAQYTQLSNKSAGTYALGNPGIGNGIVYGTGPGQKPSAFSLGMKHTF